MMKKIYVIILMILTVVTAHAKTLIIYYSYTNNVESIVKELCEQISADVVEIEPAEKGLDYAANNYALGSTLISEIRNNPNDASSYPAIDSVNVNLEEYDTIIIGAPLWWSQMAAPLQTFFFQNGDKMAGKSIGLIVSSHSSGISGVESDARRLIPNGNFLTPSLWIKSAQTSNAKSLLQNWLKEIKYSEIATGISEVYTDSAKLSAVYNLSGVKMNDISLSRGIYIINGVKTAILR